MMQLYEEEARARIRERLAAETGSTSSKNWWYYYSECEHATKHPALLIHHLRSPLGIKSGDQGVSLRLAGVLLNCRDDRVHSHRHFAGISTTNSDSYVLPAVTNLLYTDLVCMVDRCEPVRGVKHEIDRLRVTLVKLEFTVNLIQVSGKRSN